jgi:hypothetical protein
VRRASTVPATGSSRRRRASSYSAVPSSCAMSRGR